jgi:hypothetical protein
VFLKTMLLFLFLHGAVGFGFVAWDHRVRYPSNIGMNQDFVRIKTKNGGNKRVLEIETRITTFERNDNDILELHSQIHFGSQEYFEYYNSDEFSSRFDRVHYELLVDESLLTTTTPATELPERYLSNDRIISASASDQATAQQYGLICQVDAINYTKPNWFHADLTRQDFLALINSGTSINKKLDFPLWTLASSSPTWPGYETLSSIFKPTTPSTVVVQRLFSNLFLPGEALTTTFRLLFWALVPSPEVFILLLDWSSIFPRPKGDIFLPVAVPVVESLLTGNLMNAKKLIFGQVIAAGHKSNRNENEVLIGKRNDYALDVVVSSFKQEKCRSVALLYGAMHCPDLYQKLTNEGFKATKTRWRPAWSVIVPEFSLFPGRIDDSFRLPTNTSALGFFILTLFLGLGGLDWISTLQDIERACTDEDILLAVFTGILYVLRHAAIYLSFVKFAVNLNNVSEVFEALDSDI